MAPTNGRVDELIERVDRLCQAVESWQGDHDQIIRLATTVQTMCERQTKAEGRLDTQDKRIDDIDTKNNRWNSINTFASVIAAAIGVKLQL